MSKTWESKCECGDLRVVEREDKYDSEYCTRCNEWINPPCFCGGTECEWFPVRPEKRESGD